MNVINRAIQRGEAIGVDPDMGDMISQIQTLYRASDGCFTPAIGKNRVLVGIS